MRTWRGRFAVSAVVFAVTMLAGHPARPADRPLPEEKVRPVRVARFEQPPVIDGRLDEAEWQHAALLRDFYQTRPGDNVAPSYPTEVRLGCDDKYLYLGIRATDDPRAVRASVAKRDDLAADDYVAVYLDTFDDRRRAYVLMFNPLGVQQDGVFAEGREVDFSVDVVMRSKGLVTADGYTIEIAIPFNSLRYEAGRGKLWGLHVLRRIRHLDEEDSWMPLRREQAGATADLRARFLDQAGHLTGIEEIAGGRTLEIIPTLTLSETGRRVPTLPRMSLLANPLLTDPGRFVNRPAQADPGLTAKLALSSGVSLDLALNPDFAQVEADQLVVTANQRFPLFFEEKRPFFLEGIDIFQTPLRAVHTRTIIDPDFALKLSGKRGRSSFGLLLASDNAPGSFSDEERTDPDVRPGIERFLDKNAYVGVLRLKRDVGRESNVGLIATSYDFIERHNHTAGVDGRLKLDAHSFITFQALGTTSRRFFYDPQLDKNVYRTGNGFGYFAQYQRATRHLNLTLSGEGRTPDYVAQVGFTRRTDTNSWDLQARYNSEPKPESRLISWSLEYNTHAQFDWRGRMQYAYNALRPVLNFKRQAWLRADIYRDYARLFEEEFGPQRTASRQGAFTGAPERSTVWKGFTVGAGTAPSRKYSAEVFIDYSWKAFDYDFGGGPRFPRVSPAALADPQAPLDPGPGDTQDISSSFNWQPTDAMRFTLNYTKSRLVRNDTKRVAYDQNLPSLRVLYQFTRFTFARARIDYDSLHATVRGQFLLGWTPSPGTAFYVGYNDDLNRNGYSPFTGQYEPGLHRNSRTFFIKFSYLFRHNL
ncbi:MAG TPA: DUF5916 domain-containing protein [Blastocatellia bacterium]|nr:DUF5916 domain-containing protein [Blastocatellia bacterium]